MILKEKMMKIEVAKDGERMTMSGSSLIDCIQNKSMPLLDLLVRESVQNSLDAFKKDTEYVTVNFGVNKFDNARLAKELEGIGDALIKKYSDRESKYLYIKDGGTEGLTGPLHYNENKNGSNPGNLLKLVYEIAKPQEKKGAGGSWGYGKSVYFRVGIGLVIYYSRIKLGTGEYQSRLAACLVENEKYHDALLRSQPSNSQRGLAWWGKEYAFMSDGTEVKCTIPETDEIEINKFLSIFGFEPFGDYETGTAIIIPFIDEKKLLSNNIIKPNGNKGEHIPWLDSIEEYLRIACQRWYIGRINNRNYYVKQKQPYLRVAINGNWIDDCNMAQTFIEFRKLYNLALNKIKINENGYHCESVRIKKYLMKPESGYIAYKMYNKDELKMSPPDNYPNPFFFVKNRYETDDYKEGDIIVSYFRKPGMVVNYDTQGEWVNKIKYNNEKTGNFLLAAFVLNSDNKFNQDKITELDTIEEYFRASEAADHAAWNDITVGDESPGLLGKIQKGVGKKISQALSDQKEKKNGKSSSLSKLFTDMLLPPEGFGRQARHFGKKSGGGSGTTVHHKNVRLKVYDEKAKINGNKMILPIDIKTDKAVNKLKFCLEIATDSNGSISLEEWKKDLGLDVPFYIENIGLDELITSSNKKDGKVRITYLGNKKEKQTYGMQITSSYAEGIHIKAEIEIMINDFMAQMAYKIKESE